MPPMKSMGRIGGGRAWRGVLLLAWLLASLVGDHPNPAWRWIPRAEAARGNPDLVRILSFNVLAPCWASPEYYPASTAPRLDRFARRQAILNLLKAQADAVDIFALQETTREEFAALAAGLGDKWLGFQADHRPDYWSNWITPGLPWEPNGVALFVRRGRFGSPSFADVALSDSGNHAAVFTGLLADGRVVRCASLHLDSDRAANRKRELGALLQRLSPRPGQPDFLAGDFNFETDSGNLKADLRDAGFRNILEELGVAQNTHPWDTRYYGADNWGIIDHILVRQGRPAAGEVLDFGLFELYPDDEEARINENLDRCGSDHFPVYGTAALR